MKRIILLLFSLCCLTAYGQEALFSYRSNGDIISRSDYVKPFGKFRYIKGITPFILKQERTESAPNGDTYQIKCEKFRNWENDPGDLHTIVIRHEGKQIFSLLNSDDGWGDITEEPNDGLEKNAFYYKIDLDDNTIAILLRDVYIMSQPPLLTLIVIRDGKANLVFNRPSYINKVSRKGKETIFTLQANSIEIIEENGKTIQLNEPELHTLTFKDGMVYYL